MLELLWTALPSYEGITPLTAALYVLAGVFGALVRVAWLNKPIRGFYRDARGGVRMGFYAEIIVAAAVALIVQGNPIRAGIVSIFAPWILDGLKVVVVEKVPAMLKAALEIALTKSDTTK